MVPGGVAVPQTAGGCPPRVGEDKGGLDQVVVRLDGVTGRLGKRKRYAMQLLLLFITLLLEPNRDQDNLVLCKMSLCIILTLFWNQRINREMVMKITLPVRFRRRVRRRGGSARGGGSDRSPVHRRRLLYLIRFENAFCDVLIRKSRSIQISRAFKFREAVLTVYLELLLLRRRHRSTRRRCRRSTLL